MIVSVVLAAALSATPADGHSVAVIGDASLMTEVNCDGLLQGAYLAPAGLGYGLRAPIAPGAVKCTIKSADGKEKQVTVEFADDDIPVGVAPDHPIVLGVDKEGALNLRGDVSHVEGSAGPVKLEQGTAKATLPTIRMPQHLVVLVTDSQGDANYAVIPLLGKAKASMKVTKRNAKIEVIVAGHRTGGFTSDKKGKVEVSVPAPPGFLKGALVVTDSKGRTAESSLELPAAKPLYALAAIGPDTATANKPFVVYAAGSNPMGLPPDDAEFEVLPGSGAQVYSKDTIKPGLWRVSMTAPQAGDVAVVLKLKNATKNISVKVQAPPPPPTVAQTEQPKTKPADLTSANKTNTPATNTSATTGTNNATTVSQNEQPKSAVSEVVKTDTKPKVTKRKDEDEPSDIHLGILLEAGYMTNNGAIAGFAPGASVQISYRVLDGFDVGLDVDALVTTSNSSANVQVGGASVATTSNTQILQGLAGPWARYHFSDLIAVDLSAGAGLSRVAQSISAENVVNTSGVSNSFAFGGQLGIDLTFGIARGYIGARYAQSQASGDVTGLAGGLAALAGVGVDLGL
jgi:hypothetical protein